MAHDFETETELTKPNFHIAERSDYAARSHKNPAAYKRYFDHLAGLVRQWGITDMISTPGAGVIEYHRRRRIMPEIARIAKVAKFCADDPRGLESNVIPADLRWYPIPCYIYRGQGAGNKDWLIDKEMGDVIVYALENTNIHPSKDPKCKAMNREALEEALKQRTVMTRFEEGATGVYRLQLAPGCAVVFPLCADPWLPRLPLPDQNDNPATRLVPYDPTNPMHNVNLRGEPGVGTDARLYVYPKGSNGNVKE